MMMLTQGVTNIADIAWEVKCREEDMRQRAVDNERRAIDDVSWPRSWNSRVNPVART